MSTALLSAVVLPLAAGGGEESESESEIPIGHHVEREFLGVTFNLDTIWTTLLAAGLVLLLGFLARRALTRDADDHVPTKLQLVWETVVGEVNPRSRTTSAGCTPTSRRWRWPSSSSSCSPTGSSCCRPSSTTTCTCCRRPPPTPT